MNEFRLGVVPSMSCAPGAIAGVGREIEPGSKVLIISDPIMKQLGHLERLVKIVEQAGGEVEQFSDIVSDPREASVNDALARFKVPDLILAIGGGSTMDAAKIIAVLIGTGEKCEAYRLAAKRFPKRTVSLIALPTTAGTGSETTGTSVLSSDEGVKYWYAARGQEPDHIILDPELMVDLPAFLTAATGCDALVHSLEAATNIRASSVNNLYAYEGIRLCLENLPTAVKEPHNLEARAHMSYAATLGGTAINNCGTAIAHCIGHALGSLTHMHHGLAVTLGLAAALPDLVAENPLYDDIGRLFGVKSRHDLPEAFDVFVGETGLNLKQDVGDLTGKELLAQMMKEENIAMLHTTLINKEEAVLLNIAERTLAYAR